LAVAAGERSQFAAAQATGEPPQLAAEVVAAGLRLVVVAAGLRVVVVAAGLRVVVVAAGLRLVVVAAGEAGDHRAVAVARPRLAVVVAGGLRAGPAPAVPHQAARHRSAPPPVCRADWR
jgi:hypothetical protein